MNEPPRAGQPARPADAECNDLVMSDQPESFDEMIARLMQEFGKSVERLSNFDIQSFASSIGLDPEMAKQWVEEANAWVRSQTEPFAQQHDDEPAYQDPPAPRDRHEAKPSGHDPLRGAGPHPLDMPTDEQGLALAALVSGRWTVEPGTEALAARGEGPGPTDSLGLVRELRARDWMATDGSVTDVGRHALQRWLAAAAAR